MADRKPTAPASVVNLYEAGAKRNIAAFHQQVIEGRHDNPTVRRTIDGTLTAILGREAGHRGVRLTMAELLRGKQASHDGPERTQRIANAWLGFITLQIARRCVKRTAGKMVGYARSRTLR